MYIQAPLPLILGPNLRHEDRAKELEWTAAKYKVKAAARAAARANAEGFQ
jgi:hypothetical protein